MNVRVHKLISRLTKLVLLLVLICSTYSCEEDSDERYIFFLHNRYLEEHDLEDIHPEYGRVEYLAILEEFENSGLKVISEQREGNVNARTYALNIVDQINDLFDKGISPQAITVVGTSKGGYIAQYVSTLANNPDLNYVFVGCFRNEDITTIPEINFCGNILTIYDRSDPYGVSAIARKRNSTCEVEHFKEIELNTGLGHGFLFKPLKEWIEPTIKWASGEYDAIQTTEKVYSSGLLEVTQLSDHLYVHKSYLKSYHNYPCNGMVYINDGEAVVLDAPTDDSTALELINWVVHDLKCDIKAIVINHFHIDCLGGLSEFHKIGVPSYANDMTIKLSESEKAHNDIVPQHGFSHELMIEVGNTSIENRYFGQGHSPDNIVTYIKSEKALFGGCLLKAYGAGRGSLTDANVKAWSNTVKSVKDEYAENLKHVIPGHGEPGGIELLDYTIELFSED